MWFERALKIKKNEGSPVYTDWPKGTERGLVSLLTLGEDAIAGFTYSAPEASLIAELR